MRATLVSFLLCCGGTCALTMAQPVTVLKYESRIYDAGNNDGWVSTLSATPGSRIEVRAVVSLENPGTITGGLSRLTFQPVISSWTPGDTLITNAVLGLTGPANGIGPVGGSRSTPIGTVSDQSGVYGRISPWGANTTSTSTFLRGHLGTGTASGLLRIAQNHITNWIGVGPTSGATANNNFNGNNGVSIAQIDGQSHLTTDPAYEASQINLVVFKFSFTLSGVSGARTLDISTPPSGFGHTLSGSVYIDDTRWFNAVSSAPNEFARATPMCLASHVLIDVPAPTSTAVIGVLLAIGGRRRRVWCGWPRGGGGGGAAH